MFFEKRAYRVTRVASADELADKLFNGSWTLCTAFALGDTLWVNDASSEDGAQEYAVLRAGRQIESITASWARSKDALLATIRKVMASSDVDFGPKTLRTNHPAAPNSCPYCA